MKPDLKVAHYEHSASFAVVQTSLPYPAIFPRHASHLPILLHLSFTPPDTTSSATPLSPAAASTPPRSVAIDKAVLILSRRTLARGGRETRPQFGLVEMRRVEVKLWAGEDTGDELTQMSSLAPMDSRASAKVGEVEDGRAHLRLVCGEKGVDLKLEFPMQTEGMSQSGKRLIPARELLLSCRTPNLEVEVRRARR